MSTCKNILKIILRRILFFFKFCRYCWNLLPKLLWDTSQVVWSHWSAQHLPVSSLSSAWLFSSCLWIPSPHRNVLSIFRISTGFMGLSVQNRIWGFKNWLKNICLQIQVNHFKASRNRFPVPECWPWMRSPSPAVRWGQRHVHAHKISSWTKWWLYSQWGGGSVSLPFSLKTVLIRDKGHTLKEEPQTWT